jgi:type II secretory pathway pseudopilin PulG
VSSPGGTTPAGRSLVGLPAGVSLIEVVLVLAFILVASAAATPVLGSSLDSARARQAANYVASACRTARQTAVARAASTALVFEQQFGRWRFDICTDGNGNGVRRLDISRGRDVCMGAIELGQLFNSVTIAVDPALPDPDGGPGSADPVRFGASDIASFSAAGTATSGTVFVRSTAGAQYAVRVGGVTGRTRLLRYDTGLGGWREV